jgi:hypothetical protein
MPPDDLTLAYRFAAHPYGLICKSRPITGLLALGFASPWLAASEIQSIFYPFRGDGKKDVCITIVPAVIADLAYRVILRMS